MAQSSQHLLHAAEIASLPAVKAGRSGGVWLFFFDSPLYFIGVAAMAKMFHPALFAGLLTSVTLGWIDVLSGGILLAFLLACPLADYLFMTRRRQHIVGVFAAMQRMADGLLDALQGMLTLKAFNAVPRFRARLAAHAAALRTESMSALRATMMRSGITRGLALSGTACLLTVNTFRVTQGDLDPAVLLLTLLILWQAFRPLFELENVLHTLWAAQEIKPAMQALSQAEKAIGEPHHPAPLPARNDLRFERVSYRWPGQAEYLFNELSLCIEENRHTALIGPSGSGKSTLAQLITRFAVPDSGTILLGGQPIDSFALSALRSRISWVSQQVFLFDGTLAENLRLSAADATDEALWHALQQAQLADWVRTLPQQLNTPLSEGGSLLSGGQRQRVAIARALLKESPLLILDEITASLDVASEVALQQVIATLSRRCTLISIAHRMNAVAQADHIVVLQAGRIVEQGAPAQLRKQSGYFASLESAS
ncbi:hypothetical protein CBI35_23515 [Pantoea sp. AV62]|nr:hypothetical protein CBI35_23515 [Pantoea sp. AV62]